LKKLLTISNQYFKNMCPIEVSVLIPVHGDAPFLSKTLNSLLDQSELDFEVILILDRVDASILVTINNFQEKLKNFRIIISQNPGISNALNAGLSESKAKYIARLDADDEMLPNRLKTQKEFLDLNQDYVLVGTQINLITEDGNYIRTSNYPLSNSKLQKLLQARNTFAHPSVMFRKNINGIEVKYAPQFDGCEDYFLWLQMCKKGKICNLDLALTNYRQHAKQITRTAIPKSQIDLQRLARCLSAYETQMISSDGKFGLDQELKLENLSKCYKKILGSILLRTPLTFKRLLVFDMWNISLIYRANGTSPRMRFASIFVAFVAMVISPIETLLFYRSIAKEFRRRNSC